MKQAKDAVMGMITIIGLMLIMCCDTNTPGQLFWIVFLGFGLLCLGGRGLIVNNRRG